MERKEGGRFREISRDGREIRSPVKSSGTFLEERMPLFSRDYREFRN